MTEVSNLLEKASSNIENSGETASANATEVIENQAQLPPDNNTSWQHNSVYLAGGLLLFCVILFGLIAYLLTKNISGDKINRTFALPLVIVSALFLVVVGFSQEQIAPVMALLSAIAGYLLGSGTTSRDNSD